MAVGIGWRLALAALGELEKRGLPGPAAAAARRLWAALPPSAGPADKLPVAHSMLRLGLALDRERLDDACSVWRSLGACGDEEGLARSLAMDLVRGAIAGQRAADARSIAEAERARAPGHGRASYVAGCLLALEGDDEAADRVLEIAQRSVDPDVARAARGRRTALPLGPRPGLDEEGGAQIEPAARLALASRLCRQAGRYSRLRGLDLLLELARQGSAQGAVLAAAAGHVDRIGRRLTAIERDRIEEIVRRLAPAAEIASAFEARLSLLARLSERGPEERLALYASELDGPPSEIARLLRRGSRHVHPVFADPRPALAAEALRVTDILRSGGPVELTRLGQLFDAAAPDAGSVATLWALVPCFLARHADLGLARDRLRPILAAVLSEGPRVDLDVAATARALDALKEDVLAEIAARRAADEGDPAPLVERTIRRAWALAERAPEEALRLLDRAASI